MNARTFRIVILLAACVFCFASTGQEDPPKKKDLSEKRKLAAQKHKEQNERLRKQLEPLLQYDIEQLEQALRFKIVDKFGGAILVGEKTIEGKPKYLGTIDNQFAPDSIFNEYGTYGSEYSSDSIWNTYGSYGGEYSSGSPFNKFSSTPPVIIKDKKVIGVLTVNKLANGAVDPNWLASYFKN